MNEDAFKARLLSIAKDKQISYNEIWKQLILERFLARVASSKYHNNLIFKGGLLLAHYIPLYRETTDIDLLMDKIDGSNIKQIVEEIISENVSDGFTFSIFSIKEASQPHMEYSGWRVKLNVKFGNHKDKIQIDLATGDVVHPLEENFSIFMYKGKPLFSGEITLLVYPPETIFAEKLETIISKGTINSRMKDYHDILLMIRTPNLLDLAKLKTTLNETFDNRGTKKNITSITLLYTNRTCGVRTTVDYQWQILIFQKNLLN